MSRYAIVDENGLVVQVVIWEGAAWCPPAHHYVIFSPVCNVGDMYDIENDVLIITDRTNKDDV